MKDNSWPPPHDEMAELIQRHPWERTALGPIADWPERLRGLVDAMLLDPAPGALLWGNQGILIYNSGYAEICGQKHPGVLGMPLRAAWPEAAGFNGKMLDDVMSGQRLVFRDACFRLVRDGMVRDSWFDLYYGPVPGADGAVVAVKATVIETTGKVLGEQGRLRQQQEMTQIVARLHGLTAATSDVIYRMSPDWSEMRELDGRGFIKDTAAPYRSWLDEYIPADEQARVRAAIAEAIQRKTTFELEHRVRRVDGGTGWTLSRAVPMLDRDGEIEEWIGAASDITERKAAESALRESERLFRTLFDSIDEGFCVIEFIDGPHGPLSDYVHVMANPAYAANAGIENVVGQRVREMVPLEAGAWVDIYKRVLLTGEPVRFERTLERTGRYLELAALRIEPVERCQVAVLFRDVSTRHRAELALRDLNETLERRVTEEVGKRTRTEDALRQAQKMEAVGQLTGGIAHDFNNMLAVISNAIELVRRRTETQDELVHKYLGLAKGGIARASQLTQRLLAFSRQQPLHPGPVSVNELVRELSPLLKHSLGGTIVFDTLLDPDAWPSYVDPNQFENVLLNLVVNARDAMEHGGRLTIETRNRLLEEAHCNGMANLVPGPYVTVAIRDTGIGMTPEIMAKAFDPFFTTKEVGHGTGLGLSQVYGFVRQSRGHVKIDSSPGKGTVVEIYLPRHTGEVADRLADTAPDGIKGGNREAILVTDDEASVRILLGEMLSYLGYRVFAADSGAAALRMLEAHPEIKLLVTDVLMPEMNGRQLVDEAIKRKPGLKILFTTGYAGNVGLGDRINGQGINLLMKPFSIEDLALRLRSLLDPAEPQAFKPSAA
jgi:signal transduction histidine kinase/ActR/RegA family two-component response regulator